MLQLDHTGARIHALDSRYIRAKLLSSELQACEARSKRIGNLSLFILFLLPDVYFLPL